MRALAAASILLAVAVALLARNDARLPAESVGEEGGPRDITLVGVPSRDSPLSRRVDGWASAGHTLAGSVPYPPAPSAGHGAFASPIDEVRRPRLPGPGAMRIVDRPASRPVEQSPVPPSLPRAAASIVPPVEPSAATEDPIEALTRLYLAFFTRAPDYEGLNYYIAERDEGRTLDAIANEAAGSLEFQQRYGRLDNAAFVDFVYQNVSGGPASAADRAFWVGQLDSGLMSRGELMVAFSESDGFRALTVSEVFVTVAYAELLDRAPEPSEFARWVDLLDEGLPRDSLVRELLGGPPAK